MSLFDGTFCGLRGTERSGLQEGPEIYTFQVIGPNKRYLLEDGKAIVLDDLSESELDLTCAAAIPENYAHFSLARPVSRVPGIGSAFRLSSDHFGSGYVALA